MRFDQVKFGHRIKHLRQSATVTFIRIAPFKRGSCRVKILFHFYVIKVSFSQQCFLAQSFDIIIVYVCRLVVFPWSKRKDIAKITDSG